MEKWNLFLRRHHSAVKYINDHYPNFWRLIERYVMTTPIIAARNIRITRDVGTQTDLSGERGDIETSPKTRNTDRREAAKETQNDTNKCMLSLDCWNCGGEHKYTMCPLPRQKSFCYGCGEAQVTVRTCSQCGPSYKESLFQEVRGPRNRSHRRCAARARSGSRENSQSLQRKGAESPQKRQRE